MHFHDLWHEATLRLFEKGLNPVEVATITGHKHPRMLLQYTHINAENVVERLSKVREWDATIFSLSTMGGQKLVKLTAYPAFPHEISIVSPRKIFLPT